MLEDPRSSRAARILHWIIVILIAASIMGFVAETMSEIVCSVVQSTCNTHTSYSFVFAPPSTQRYGVWPVNPLIFFYLDAFVNTFFTIEFVIRFFVAPNKKLFIREVFNWFDFIAILPFYLGTPTPLPLLCRCRARPHASTHTRATGPWQRERAVAPSGTHAAYFQSLQGSTLHDTLTLTLVSSLLLTRCAPRCTLHQNFAGTKVLLTAFKTSVKPLLIPVRAESTVWLSPHLSCSHCAWCGQLYFLLVFVLIFSTGFYLLERGVAIEGADGGTTRVFPDGTQSDVTDVFIAGWVILVT